VTSLHTGHLDNTDLTQNDMHDLKSPDDFRDSDDLEEKSVTQTDDNMAFITSILISKEGKDLATITEHFPATSLDGASGFQVSGQLSGLTGVKGHLELVWPHPGPAEAGVYTCDIDALNNHGRSFVFTKTLSVSEEEVSIQDLVTHLQKAEQNLQNTIDIQAKTIDHLENTIQQMNSTIDKQAQTIQQMNSTTDNQAQTIQQMNSKIENQAKVITSLNQSLTDLSSKARQEPDVFFSAVAKYGWVDVNKSLVFYSPISNQGSSFDENTGIFTAPLSGFYHFELHIYSNYDDALFNIEKNGVKVVSVACNGDDNRGSSNSVYLSLGQGDKVSAVSQTRSYVRSGTGDYQWSTFSGRLVALA